MFLAGIGLIYVDVAWWNRDRQVVGSLSRPYRVPAEADQRRAQEDAEALVTLLPCAFEKALADFKLWLVQ